LTLLFFDGFETYDAAATQAVGMGDVYDLHDDGTGSLVTIIASTRITDGQAMRINFSLLGDTGVNIARGPQLPLTAFSSADEWVFGVAMRATGGLGTSASVRPIFELLDSDSNRIISLRVHDNGDLTLDRISTNLTLATLDTATTAITGTDWNYVEMKVKLSASSGTYEVRVNEVNVMSGATTSTTSTGATRPSHLRFGHILNQPLDFDDLYILDTTGSLNTDFLGDIRVQRLRPNAVGDVNQFTLFGGATNWESVDELGEDDDTTYVESKTVAQRDLYNYENLPTSVTGIFGVIAKPVLRKSDAGSRTYKLIVSSNSFEDETATLYPAGSYVRQAQIFETDPNTGALWEEAGVNNAQFGVEIVS